VVEARPRSLVDQEVVQARASEGRGVVQELHQERLAARPGLPDEQRIHDPRGLHQARQRLPLPRRQLRDVGADGHGREAGGHDGQLRGIGERAGGLRLFAGNGGGHGHRDQGGGDGSHATIIPSPARECQRIGAIDLRPSRA
jgi:hypothetical protein